MKLIDNRNDLLSLLPKGMVVAELGVFKCEFSDILLKQLQPSKLYLVDIFPNYMCSGDKDGNNIVHENLEQLLPDIINKYKANPEVVITKSTSSDFLRSLADDILDMVYIDANHSYEYVKMDLELSLHKVKKGGFICGHDYTSTMFPDIIRAVDEFCLKSNLKIEYLTNDGCPTYVIIK